jgi:hypothetical protein
MLAGIVLNNIVISPVQNSMANVRFGFAMFERGRNAFDENLHLAVLGKA